MKIKKAPSMRKTKLASLRADSAAQPAFVPPQQYPFYLLPTYQCPECECAVKWEVQALDPNPQGISSAFGSCLSGSIGVPCSRAGKRFRVPLLIALAIEVQAAPPALESVPLPAEPPRKMTWLEALLDLFRA